MKKSDIDRLILKAQQDANQDMMVISCDKDSNVHLGLVGDINRVAEALFAVILNNNNPEASTKVYTMIKNVIYNIIINPSDQSEDMLTMVADVADAAARMPFSNVIPFNPTIN